MPFFAGSDASHLEQCGLHHLACTPQLDPTESLDLTDIILTQLGAVLTAFAYLIGATIANKFFVERVDYLLKPKFKPTLPVPQVTPRSIVAAATLQPPLTAGGQSKIGISPRFPHVNFAPDDEHSQLLNAEVYQANTPSTAGSGGTKRGSGQSSPASAKTPPSPHIPRLSTFLSDSISRFYFMTILWSVCTAIFLLTVAFNPLRCDLSCRYESRGETLKAALGMVLLFFYTVVVSLLYTVLKMTDLAFVRSERYYFRRKAAVVGTTAFLFLLMLVLFLINKEVTRRAAIYVDSFCSLIAGVCAAILGVYVPIVIADSVPNHFIVRQVRFTAVFLFLLCICRGLLVLPGLRHRSAFSASGEVMLSTNINLAVIFGAIIVLRTQRDRINSAPRSTTGSGSGTSNTIRSNSYTTIASGV